MKCPPQTCGHFASICVSNSYVFLSLKIADKTDILRRVSPLARLAQDSFRDSFRERGREYIKVADV